MNAKLISPRYFNVLVNLRDGYVSAM
jgi:hypothetical protein